MATDRLIGPLFTQNTDNVDPYNPVGQEGKGSGRTLVWIGIALLTVFVILSIVYWTVPLSNPTKLTSYVGMVGFLSTAVVVITFFFTQRQAQINSLQAINAQREALAQQNSTALTQFFANNFESLLRLYKQINLDDAQLQALPDPPITAKVVGLEILALGLLFQGMENVVTRLATTGVPIDSPEYVGYYNSYRKLFKNSELARRQWALNSNIYNLYTQQFVRGLASQGAAPP